MKKIIAIACLLCCCLTATSQKQLTILHTNDSHSTIYPLNPNLADTLKAGRGGYLRRADSGKCAADGAYKEIRGRKLTLGPRSVIVFTAFSFTASE